MKTTLLYLTYLIFTFVAYAETPLVPSSTPGALNPAVMQSTIHQTICKSGWTATVRPASSYTTQLKLIQLTRFAHLDSQSAPPSPKDYEEDHRVPLELGGHPTDVRNLWPEPWARPYGAHEKDRLENSIKRDVCKERLSLAAGRAVFMGDWWEEYKRRYESKKGSH